jgi:hypothetical protein
MQELRFEAVAAGHQPSPLPSWQFLEKASQFSQHILEKQGREALRVAVDTDRGALVRPLCDEGAQGLLETLGNGSVSELESDAEGPEGTSGCALRNALDEDVGDADLHKRIEDGVTTPASARACFDWTLTALGKPGLTRFQRGLLIAGAARALAG